MASRARARAHKSGFDFGPVRAPPASLLRRPTDRPLGGLLPARGIESLIKCSLCALGAPWKPPPPPPLQSRNRDAATRRQSTRNAPSAGSERRSMEAVRTRVQNVSLFRLRAVDIWRPVAPICGARLCLHSVAQQQASARQTAAAAGRARAMDAPGAVAS